MPVYEYACKQCSQKFEVLLRSSKTSVDCPHCHSEDLQRLLSPFNSASASAMTESFCPPEGCGSCAEAGSCMMN